MDKIKALETEAQTLRQMHCIKLHIPDLCEPEPVQEVFKRYPVLTQIKDMGMPTIAGLLAYGELFELDPEDLDDIETETLLVMLQYELLRLKKRLRAEISRI